MCIDLKSDSIVAVLPFLATIVIIYSDCITKQDISIGLVVLVKTKNYVTLVK